MSINQINGKSFDFSKLQGGKVATPVAGSARAVDFSSELKLQMASIQSQTVGALVSSALSPGKVSAGTSFSDIVGAGKTAGISSLDAMLGSAASISGTHGVSATGCNMGLFDPESAYRMMTDINARAVAYKAESSEMGDMKAYVSTLQQEAIKLGGTDVATGREDIRARVQAFADAYNGWMQRFGGELKDGGMLAGTQAARIAQWELEQSIANPFHGAKDGLHGMADLGLSIDPVTKRATVDNAHLDAALANGKSAAIGALHEFTAHFAKAAELWNSAGNFINNRLDNLSHVVGYIDTNMTSLQAEFGLGDPAKPTGQLARALANYNATHGVG
ncbi:flagellar filament capping protein FliD [uncultured Dechloromonas sp.]|uniref:flagellar filament capping protein FliD n=1 Tax=uncultured Dechloromonas sp. TaxID=171719 RepID=UPI0025D46CF7|nr:flagellar filament capping protein FliD [uncultured Dechloromonas sp.]